MLNLTGTNSGDQFTSETVSTIIGRGSAGGAGAAQEITLGTNLSMSGTTLNATGGGGSLWTDGGAITYLTATGDNVAMGGSLLLHHFIWIWGPATLRLNSGATPSTGQFRITANGLGSLSGITYAADNSALGFDVDYSSGFVARNATGALIYKNGGLLEFQGSGGNSVGGAFTATNMMALDLTNNRVASERWLREPNCL